MHKNRGFTLAELMVTVVIFGTMSALGVPSYLNMVERGRAAEAKANLKAIQMAQSVYKLRNNRYWTPDLTNIAAINTTLNLDLDPSARYYTDNIRIVLTGTGFRANMERTGSSIRTVSIAQTGDAWEWDGVIGGGGGGNGGCTKGCDG